jgi:outer membrane protein, heavy metal efflux system
MMSSMSSVLALGLAATSAAASSPLTLDEVLASVDTAFVPFRAAALETSLAEGERLAAEGAFDLTWKSKVVSMPVGYYDSLRVDSLIEKPTALWGTSVFGGWRYGRGDFAIYDEKAETGSAGEVRAGLDVPLWRDGPIDRRRASLAKAELGIGVASLSVREQRIQLHRTTAHRYWAWVAAKKRLDIAEALLANVRQRHEALSARVETGDLPPVDWDDNARVIAQREAQRIAALRGVEQAQIELGLLLGDAGSKQLRFEDRPAPGLPDPPVEAGDEEKVLTPDRPEPDRLHLQLLQQRIELEWVENQLQPAIDLQLAVSRDLGSARPQRPDLHDPVLELSLSIEIPLQNRALEGRRDVAVATAERLELQRTFIEQRIEAELRDARSALRASRARVEATRVEIALAKSLEAAEQTKFEEGEGSILFVNLREQQTVEAELRRLDALLDYHRAAADWRAALGR